MISISKLLRIRLYQSIVFPFYKTLRISWNITCQLKMIYQCTLKKIKVDVGQFQFMLYFYYFPSITISGNTSGKKVKTALSFPRKKKINLQMNYMLPLRSWIFILEYFHTTFEDFSIVPGILEIFICKISHYYFKY